MKRSVCVWLALAVVAAGSVTPASAQSPPDEWNVFVAPYLMGAAMSGTTTVRGLEVDIDVSASDIFSNLQFGAMGIGVARKGDWGFGTDLIWMALGTTVGDTNVDFNQGAFAFYGLRRLSPAAELTFGLRVNTLQGELTFKGPDITRNQDKTWVDPIVGVNLQYSDGTTPAIEVLHRGRRVRCWFGFHMASVPGPEYPADRDGVVGVWLSMAGLGLRDR